MSSPTGQANCTIAGTSTVDPQCEWSYESSSDSSALGTAIGTGYANTSQMISQSNYGGYAATTASAYLGGSKTDWFLPSILELNQLCRYAWRMTADSSAITCADESGEIRTGFSTDFYWSSSEYDFESAWVQDFRFGDGSYGWGKVYTSSVRPVRAF
jgi:hypothetical protein